MKTRGAETVAGWASREPRIRSGPTASGRAVSGRAARAAAKQLGRTGSPLQAVFGEPSKLCRAAKGRLDRVGKALDLGCGHVFGDENPAGRGRTDALAGRRGGGRD